MLSSSPPTFRRSLLHRGRGRCIRNGGSGRRADPCSRCVRPWLCALRSNSCRVMLWLACRPLCARRPRSPVAPAASGRFARPGLARRRRLAVGETVILLHRPLPSAGVSIAMERESVSRMTVSPMAITATREAQPVVDSIGGRLGGVGRLLGHCVPVWLRRRRRRRSSSALLSEDAVGNRQRGTARDPRPSLPRRLLSVCSPMAGCLGRGRFTWFMPWGGGEFLAAIAGWTPSTVFQTRSKTSGHDDGLPRI